MRNPLKDKLKKTILYSLLERMRELSFFARAMRKGSFSQNEEDLSIVHYFSSKVGRYIDVGANHPFVISNTYLLYRKGWSGITIDPLPRQHKAHRFWRPRDVALNIGIGERKGSLRLFQFIPDKYSTFDSKRAEDLVRLGGTLRGNIEVPVLTLADVLQSYGRKLGNVDLLCVDAEGMDLQVLRGNDWGLFQPTLILCETPRDQASREELLGFLGTKGYTDIKTTHFNTFFEWRG